MKYVVFKKKSANRISFPSSEVSFIRLGPEGSALTMNDEVIASPCRGIWMIHTGNLGRSRMETPIRDFLPITPASQDFVRLLMERISEISEFPESFSIPGFPKISSANKSPYSATIGYLESIKVGFNLFLIPNQEVGNFYIAKWSDETRLHFEFVEFLKLDAPTGSEIWSYLELITTNVAGIPTLLFGDFVLSKDGSIEIEISIHNAPLQIATALVSGGLKY